MVSTLPQYFRRHSPFLLIALVLNGLVLTNTVLHFPKIGYDLPDHLRYIRVLTTHLPTAADTGEFFSPPLPYFLPSLVDKVCVTRQDTDCDLLAGKAAQVFNFLLSLGITLLFWKIAELLKPGNETFRASMLAVLGILTVYYKTFSQPRGEPYVAFFITLMMFLVLKILKSLQTITWKDGLALGVSVGGITLSRQWGALVFPALVVLFLLVLLKDARAGWRLFRAFFTAGVVAAVVGGWFYLHLYFSYGSFTAFNMKSAGFSFANKKVSFYTATGLENGALFTNPIRPTMDNTLFPIFYSETWGDYWGYFTFIRSGQYNFPSNGPAIAPYLGRVNLVSIFPTLVFLAGLVWGAIQFVKAFRPKTVDPQTFFYAFVFAGLVFSWAGYLWFLISYPGNASGDTNKASYMIQIFMLLPVLAVLFTDRLRAWKPLVYRWMMAGLFLVFVHNLPALITRYVR